MKFPISENMRGWWFALSGSETVTDGPFPTREAAINEARAMWVDGEKVDLYEIGESWNHPSPPWLDLDAFHQELGEATEIEFDEDEVDRLFSEFLQGLVDRGVVTASGWHSEPVETVGPFEEGDSEE